MEIPTIPVPDSSDPPRVASERNSTPGIRLETSAGSYSGHLEAVP
jgi:hypothetical protein